MPTRAQWIACKDAQGQPLDPKICAAYQRQYSQEEARKQLSPVPVAWDPSMPSRGLGDVVAKVTHFTGISKVVKAFSNMIGVGCNCGERQEALNAAVPFTPKESPPP